MWILIQRKQTRRRLRRVSDPQASEIRHLFFLAFSTTWPSYLLPPPESLDKINPRASPDDFPDMRLLTPSNRPLLRAISCNPIAMLPCQPTCLCPIFFHSLPIVVSVH